MSNTEITKCLHCGASLKQYWHRLTPLLVKSLVKLRAGVVENGENKVYVNKDLELSTTESMNWTKLRFHGMIAKYMENGTWKRGYWLLTRKGADFLNGKIEVPVKVKTFRNKVIDHSTELVTVSDVMRSKPYLETIEIIEFDYDYLDQTKLF